MPLTPTTTDSTARPRTPARGGRRYIVQPSRHTSVSAPSATHEVLAALHGSGNAGLDRDALLECAASPWLTRLENQGLIAADARPSIGSGHRYHLTPAGAIRLQHLANI